MAANLPKLAELDINPLLSDEVGVVALDACMLLAPAPSGQDSLARLAILPYHALEREVDTALGRMTPRPIRPEDAPAHQVFFLALSPQDVHFRMFAMMSELSPAQLARFKQIDYAREMAFIATRPAGCADETPGVARVSIDPDDIAGEFAVVVRSDLKGQGLGFILMKRLLDQCRMRCLALVHGMTLIDNTCMLAPGRGV